MATARTSCGPDGCRVSLAVFETNIDDRRLRGALHSLWVTSRRKQGSKLMFIDLESGHADLQIVVNAQELENKGTNDTEYQEFRRKFQRGDWLSVTGTHHQTSTGQVSLLAKRTPQIISVSLQPLPERASDPEFLARNRHVDRILRRESNDTLILRHRLVARARMFFLQRDFVEVNTPLLTAGFGGAVARPFETTASEHPDTTLNLRIAPELWLKRLIVGNMGKVFEIGPAFRNEGVDHTHNPEFTICEFYQVMTDLKGLMSMTEQLLSELVDESRSSRKVLKSVPDPNPLGLQGSFDRISFLPALQAALREKIHRWELPDLESASAAERLAEAVRGIGLLEDCADVTSVPKLLDTLASKLIESRITKPTWIIHHPECMSPLAKSFDMELPESPGRIVRVAARAELFIQGREYVNCYEEENSPVEQRRKFEEQLRHRNVDGDAVVDENYISALEWGMPPTGGWGCGIDRLVMLFSGRDRIADVLPFGTLTNVVGLGTQHAKIPKPGT